MTGCSQSTYRHFEEQVSEAQCLELVSTSEVACHLHHPWVLAAISEMSIIFNSLCLCLCVSMSICIGLST